MNITLKQGVISGKQNTSRFSGKIYYSFLGIPYAEPPIHSLRFRAPQPHKGWDGILHAKETPQVCAQKDKFKGKEYFGSEDCLYINVHVPQNPNNVKHLKPVMVFVHGGAFFTGSGDMHSADYLINYDVILITFNYRLHVFGFLNLGLPECPGNAGLKDQVMAFKWIKDNIEVFGGDPFNITAFGESAGAAAVHYLMLSPLNHGLFDKAILQSGSAICPWAYTEDHISHAFRLGRILGCNTDNKKDLLNFLLEVSTYDIVEAMIKTNKEVSSKNLIHIPFVPSVEYGIDPIDMVLPKHPQYLLNTTVNIPTIIGLNDLEGLIIMFGKSLSWISKFKDFDQFISNDVKKLTQQFPDVINKIKQFYFADKIICKETFHSIIDLLSDVCFANNFYNIPQAMLQKYPENPIYIYNFSYEGKLNILKELAMMSLENIELKGSCHADELFYLFYMNFGFDIAFESEKKMINTMCSLWTNFAKYGSPSTEEINIKWQSTSIENPCYLHIDVTSNLKKGLINEKRMNFWNTLRRELQNRNNSTYLKL